MEIGRKEMTVGVKEVKRVRISKISFLMYKNIIILKNGFYFLFIPKFLI